MPSPAVIEWLNSSALALAFLASTYAAVLAGPGLESPGAAPRNSQPPSPELLTLPDGRPALSDTTGTLVPLGEYRRIVSGSLLADPLLLALCEPTRIAGFSGRAHEARDAYRYAGKPGVDPMRRMEELLALKPDLVLINSLGEHAWVQRLRDAGLVVFDLGPMWGLTTFLGNVAAVGHLVQRPEAARELAWRFQARLTAIARDVPPSERRRALYVAVYGHQLYGGTRGSSYHDVLSYAGLIDAAATAYRGWPMYTPEDLLAIGPEVIVTIRGGRARLCGRAPLDELAACRAGGVVVELDPDLSSDAGLGMLEAAEELYQAVYGPRERR